MKAEEKGMSFRRLSRTWYLGCCLLDAMKYGRWEDVVALTKIRDLDPNVLLPEYGIAPMHCAAGIEPEEFGVKCVKEFLNIGGDPNVRCSEGVTPVHVASCWGRLKVLKSLLRRGGDPYLIDNEGKDAFYYAWDKEKMSKFLHEYDENRHSDHFGDKTFKNTLDKVTLIKTSQEEEDGGDLDLDSVAVALMTKHRGRVIIFESFPEEDTTSTTALEIDLTEDFAYDPKEGNKSNATTESKDCITPCDIVSCVETWTNNSDNEICTENIINVDKSHVIQVINENINKSLNSDSDAMNEEKSNSLVDRSYHPNLALTDVRQYGDFDTSYIESMDSDRTYSSSKREDFPRTNVSSTNILRETKDSIKSNTTISQTDCSSSAGKGANSKSSSLSMKTVSGVNNFKTPLDPKEMEKVEQASSHESAVSTRSYSKLPKNIRDKLQSFKVNIHYKSRTRVIRMISKSWDGFKSKNSLYCTGFEFWSSKIKSKSYPCYTASRKTWEKSKAHSSYFN